MFKRSSLPALSAPHIEGAEINVLDPSHCSVVNEASAVVKVVNGGLNTNIFLCCSGKIPV